jgi:hypothetical protein
MHTAFVHFHWHSRGVPHCLAGQPSTFVIDWGGRRGIWGEIGTLVEMPGVLHVYDAGGHCGAGDMERDTIIGRVGTLWTKRDDRNGPGKLFHVLRNVYWKQEGLLTLVVSYWLHHV